MNWVRVFTDDGEWEDAWDLDDHCNGWPPCGGCTGCLITQGAGYDGMAQPSSKPLRQTPEYESHVITWAKRGGRRR